MARIPDDEVSILKAEVSLQRLVESAGMELKRHGADLLGLCPFHDDKDPSLVIEEKWNHMRVHREIGKVHARHLAR